MVHVVEDFSELPDLVDTWSRELHQVDVCVCVCVCACACVCVCVCEREKGRKSVFMYVCVFVREREREREREKALLGVNTFWTCQIVLTLGRANSIK